MIERAVIIGNQIRIIPEDTALDVADTVADADHRPESSDDAWLSLPCVDNAMLDRASQEKKIFCSQPGAKRLADVIETQVERTWKVKFQEVQLLLMQYVFGMDTPDGTTSSFQMNNDASRKAWVEIKQYDHKDLIWVTHTFWGYIKVTGSTNFDDSHVQVNADIMVLHSTLNLTEAAT